MDTQKNGGHMKTANGQMDRRQANGRGMEIWIQTDGRICEQMNITEKLLLHDLK